MWRVIIHLDALGIISLGSLFLNVLLIITRLKQLMSSCCAFNNLYLKYGQQDLLWLKWLIVGSVCRFSSLYTPQFIVASPPIQEASFIFRGQFSVSLIMSSMLMVIRVKAEHEFRCFARALVPLHFVDAEMYCHSIL